MESDRVHARAVIMRAAVNREDAPDGRARLARLAARLRRPGDQRRRHARARAPHPRRRRDARRRLPGGRAAGERAASWSLAEPSMAGRDLAREVTPRAASRCHGEQNDGPADRRDRHRDQALDRAQPASSAAPGSSCIPAPRRRTSCSRSSPDAVFLANGPGDPAALDYVVETVRGAHRQAADVRHLPRPPAALPRGRRWRRSSCRSATAAPTTR